jgi:hypothetical protein
MGKRRTFAAGGIALATVAIAAVILAFALSSNGGSSSNSRTTFGHSLARIRAHNIRLESMIVLLTERQSRGYTAPVARSTTPEHHHASPAPTAHPSAESAPAEAEETQCDPNYEGACLDPNAADYDCEGGSGNGPDYTGEVTVVGEDHFGLDADGDGIGCETE